MENLRCHKCGKFIGKYIVSSCPATGKTILKEPHHYCEPGRDRKGRFLSTQRSNDRVLNIYTGMKGYLEYKKVMADFLSNGFTK